MHNSAVRPNQHSPAPPNGIRALRLLRQLSQADLARRVGVTQAYISLIELGEREPTPDVAKRIRAALGGAILTPIN